MLWTPVVRNWSLQCFGEWWTGWTGWKNSPAHTAVMIAFPLLFFVEVSQWFASIDSHAWPVSSAVTLICTDLVHWEPCLAQSAQGRGISVGFQRGDAGGICYASKIIAASSSQWTGAMLICREWHGWIISWRFVWSSSSIQHVLFTLIKLCVPSLVTWETMMVVLSIKHWFFIFRAYCIL